MDIFIQNFRKDFTEVLVQETNDIDISIKMGTRRIVVGHDSKLVSKILESFVIQALIEYCNRHRIKFRENDIQNRYPDFVIFNDNRPIAIDIKTSYLIKPNTIGGFTLGAYSGYFRDRKSVKNTLYPYDDYVSNLCICIIYNRVSDGVNISHCLIQPKWMIASKRAGSGNTKNIGSIKSVDDMLNGKSVFASKTDFEEYWMNY